METMNKEVDHNNTMDTTDDIFAPSNENFSLVPEEGYIVEDKPDGSKKYVCKQCNKVVKTERGVRQHISSVHKAVKRSNDNSNSASNVKKPHLDDDDTELGDTTRFCQDVVGDDVNLDEEDTFLDLSFIEKDIGKLHSTVINDDDEDTPESDETDKEDVMFIKAKLLSVEMELKNKNIIITEKNNELAIARMESTGYLEELSAAKKEILQLKENLETALAQVNSHESQFLKLKNKLKLHKVAVKRLQDSDSKSVDPTNKALKDKSKKLAESEKLVRELGRKLSEYESDKTEAKELLESKYKKTCDDLTNKTKDLKKCESELKSSEKRVTELLDKLEHANKKNTELDNINTRLKLLKDQAVECLDKNAKESVKVKSSGFDSRSSNSSARKSRSSSPSRSLRKHSSSRSPKKKKRCKIDNIGRCGKGRDYQDIHASETCQSFSKLGNCPSKATCEHRHPSKTCYEWQSSGTCTHGAQLQKPPLGLAS